MRAGHAPLAGSRPCRGFTLLEMLVVLAITGMIAGLLYPQMQSAATAIQQRQAREQVAAGAETARALAVRSGRPAMLSAMEGGSGLVVSTPAGASRQFPLGSAEGLRLALRPQAIVFYPDGSTTGGALLLTSAPGTSRGINAAYVIERDAGRLRETVAGGA